MAQKFTVSVELSASDLASPVIRRARDTYSDFGDEIGKALRQAGVRVRDFADETKKLETAVDALKTAQAQGQIGQREYANAMQQVTQRQAQLTKEIEASTPKIEKQESAFAGLAKRIPIAFAAAAAAVVLALRQMVAAFGEWQERGVAAAVATEKAIKNLSAATFRFGESAPQVAAALNQQSAALAAMSTTARTAIIQVQALVASMVDAPAQIQQVTATALRLSEVFGLDLESTARSLAGTLEGNLTRSLKQLVPELANLSDAQLVAGEAIRLIDERIKGVVPNVNSYADALLRLTKAQEENAEAAGAAVIADEAVIALQRELAEATDRARESGSSFAVVWEKLALTTKLSAQNLLTAAATLFSWNTNAEVATQRAAEYARAIEQGTAALALHNDELVKADALETRLATARDALKRNLADSGIVLRDLVTEEKKLADNEEALIDLIRTATRTELPSYQRALEQVRLKLAEVRGENVVNADSVGAVTAAHDAAIASADGYTGSLARNTAAARANTAAQKAAAAAAAEAQRAFDAPFDLGFVTSSGKRLNQLSGTFTTTRRVDQVA